MLALNLRSCVKFVRFHNNVPTRGTNFSEFSFQYGDTLTRFSRYTNRAIQIKNGGRVDKSFLFNFSIAFLPARFTKVYYFVFSFLSPCVTAITISL